jgi:tetratricopeptide (TPR) repeat protein
MRTVIVILACASFAAADEVQLKGGGKVRGVVEEQGDKIVVRMEHGSLTFARDQVEQIDRAKSSPLQEYQQRFQATDLSRVDQVEALLKWADQRKMTSAVRELRERLGRLRWDGLDQTNSSQIEIYAAWAQANGLPELAKAALKRALSLRREKIGADAEALYQLGLWAKSNNMPADALILFQEAININPDHEFARRALGFQFYAGKWRTPTEVKIAMGLIEFEGDWMTPQAKEAILTSRTLEKERKLLEEARRRLEEERTLSRIEFERRKAELDAKLSQMNQRMADLEAQRAALRTYEPTYVPVPVTVPVPVPVPVPTPAPQPGPGPARPHPPLPRPGP